MFAVVTKDVAWQRKKASERFDKTLAEKGWDYWDAQRNSYSAKKSWIKFIISTTMLSFFDMDIIPEDLDLEIPSDPALGDLAIPLMKFAKAIKKSPQVIAETITTKGHAEGYLYDMDDVEIKAVNGYLNFKFDRAKFFKDLTNETQT